MCRFIAYYLIASLRESKLGLQWIDAHNSFPIAHQKPVLASNCSKHERMSYECIEILYKIVKYSYKIKICLQI